MKLCFIFFLFVDNKQYLKQFMNKQVIHEYWHTTISLEINFTIEYNSLLS